MATPLKIRDGSGNIQELTTAEENYVAYQIGLHLAADSANGIGGLTTNASHTSTGTYTNTFFNEPVGTHPSTSITSGSTVTTLYQNQGTGAAETDSDVEIPLMWVDSASQTGFKQMPDADLNEAVERYLSTIFTNDYPGVFKLGSVSPGPNYSVWISSVFTDTRTDGTSVAYNIYRRDAYSAPTEIPPMYVRDNGGFDGIQAMTDRQIKYSFGQRAKSRIGASKIGTYQIRSSAAGAPTDPGTWISAGSATDTKQTTSEQSFTTTYVGTYTTAYSRNYTGNYQNTYTGAYNKVYTGTYTSNFAQAYVGTFETTFVGLYDIGYVRQFVGTYARNYTGPTYQRNYVSNYVRNLGYQRGYVGNLLYDRRYTRTVTLNYLGSPAVYQRALGGLEYYDAPPILGYNRATGSGIVGGYIPGGPTATGILYLQTGYEGSTYGPNPINPPSDLIRYMREFPIYTLGPDAPMGGPAPQISLGGDGGTGVDGYYLRNSPLGNYQGQIVYDISTVQFQSNSGIFYGGTVGSSNYTGPLREIYGRDRTVFVGPAPGNFVYYMPTPFDAPASGFVGNFPRTTILMTKADYIGPLVGSYTGGGSYQKNVNQLYDRRYTRNLTFASTYTITVGYQKEFAANYVPNYLRNFIGNYDGNYTRRYSGNYAGTYERNYTNAYENTFASFFNINYSRAFDINYSSDTNVQYENIFETNYIGNFEGLTIDATDETVETYTLYVRIS